MKKKAEEKQKKNKGEMMTKGKTKENTMRKELIVKGMHCKSCEMRIEDALKEVSGVLEAKASKDEDRVSVIFDERLIDEGRLKSIIRKNGFEVE
jgi:uncharacterized protein